MKLKSLSLSLAALALASCSQTELIDSNASMQGMIDYSLYAGRGTRAVALDNTNFAKFKIYSYQNLEQTVGSGNFTFSTYYDETVTKAITWAGPLPRRWPTGANDYLNFYAYSDEANVDAGSYVAATGVAAHPTFKYTVPADATKQQDLLVAAAFNQQEKSAQGKLNLDFKHALTQVAFKVKSASSSFKVKVSKVELVGANSKATFAYDGTATVGAWSAAGTPATYAFTVATPAEMDDQAFTALTATEGNLMMLPDADPKGVTLRVTYTLNDDAATVLVKEVKLEKESATAGPDQPATSPVTPWLMGKKVTYNLTLPGGVSGTKEIVFGDATMTEDWDAAEVNAEAKDIFGVSSISVAGKTDKAGFLLEINDNRQTAGTFSLKSDADWVKFSEKANDYAAAQTTLTNVAAATRANVTKKIYVYTDDNSTDAERKATITMTRTDYSTVTIEVKQGAGVVEPFNTALSGANSYIIPIAATCTLDATVKGNGQQVKLPDGYSAGNATAIPVNAGDVNITGATTAAVLWETVNTGAAPAVGTIVKNVTYADGVITFTTTATEGNAVIVVKNAGGTILWSWHIWRTNTTEEAMTKELKPITAKTGSTFSDGSKTLSGMKVLDRNLGALSAAPQSDLSAGLVYQWGRNVPFPGSINLTSGNTTAMVVAGTTPSPATGNGAIAPVTAEANPNLFYTSNTGTKDWASRNDNLWGTPLTGTVVINDGVKDNTFNSNAGSKTIYDPCPKGWRVAPAYAFANASTTTAVGVFNKGRALSIVTTDHVWFPASGRRSGSDGALSNIGTDCYSWFASVSATSTTYGSSLSFSSGSVSPTGNFSRAGVMPVRCVKE